jgi:hypothetical protein
MHRPKGQVFLGDLKLVMMTLRNQRILSYFLGSSGTVTDSAAFITF